MPGVRVVRRVLAGGEMPTLPVPGRLYDTWRPSYNRSTSHVGLATSAVQVSEGVMTRQPGRHLTVAIAIIILSWFMESTMVQQHNMFPGVIAAGAVTSS
ncbi:hypothetical protein GW17_00060619 [Ensete ventricosum]|nr:hypothetical protein GW17_00060619 [Ensete ventricosum]RZS26883.1 hypothetical protein BHM03_00060291 [Ensete ventricosum]